MKRVLGFLLAVMLLCGMSVPAFSEEENDTADDLQDIIEREAVFFQILEECGLKREETKHQGLHEGTYFPSVSWSKYGHWFYATCNVVRDGVERAWWGFWYTEQDDYEIWYKLCRQYNWLIYHGIDLVEVEDQEITPYQYFPPRLEGIYEGAPAVFRYISQYELDHQMLKPIGNWTEFRERYNTAAKRDYIDAEGKIPHKLEITDKAAGITEGDLYDTIQLEFTNKKHKDRTFSMTVWLEHGTENICRIMQSSPFHKDNEETILENVRLDLAWCIIEGLTGWDYETVRAVKNGSLERYAPSWYEETEMDRFLIRSVVEFEEESDEIKYYEKWAWNMPQYILIQGK